MDRPDTRRQPTRCLIRRWRGALLGAVAAALLSAPSTGGAATVHHQLRIRLHPAHHLLDGTDRIRCSPDTTGPYVFFLNADARVTAVTTGEKPLPYRFENGRLQVRPAPEAHPPGELTIRYRARFADPVPADPINTDNPGYGVTGTMTGDGVLLLSGAGWYPQPAFTAVQSARVVVEAPAGMIAVTAGRNTAIRRMGDRTISEWDISRVVRGLSLSAANYTVAEKRRGGVLAATYLGPQTRDLGPAYLDATIDAIRQFQDRFGPYPFEKFAVVENFFPTGYGFPSYTLMGARVLKLPFIIHTSLPHEIAHCWWGNGVLVDFSQGNWSEGLTTYVADYAAREAQGVDAARDARRQWLRNYAVIVNRENDFPLSRFTSRRDLPSKVIGYDKAAMVFHMLRRRVGAAAFREGLRALFRQRLFKVTGWSDIQRVFEEESGQALDGFFAQWIRRAGAPRLDLQRVTVAPVGGRHYRVSGRLVQASPRFLMNPEIRVTAGSKEWSTTVPMDDESSDFALVVDAPPTRLAVDPDVHLFRRLHPAEIPASVNTLKASRSPLIVLAAGSDRWSLPVARLLVRSLGLENARIIGEASLAEPATAQHDLLIIGAPQSMEPVRPPIGEVDLTRTGIVVEGRRFDRPGDVFFAVFDTPAPGSRQVALFVPVRPDDAISTARKITHYGKYSLLVFRDGINRVKKTWPVTGSPLVRVWHPVSPGEKTP